MAKHLHAMDPSELVGGITSGKVRSRVMMGGDRVELSHGNATRQFDRVPSGPMQGQWWPGYKSEYGNITPADRMRAAVNHPELLQHLETARSGVIPGGRRGPRTVTRRP